MTLDQLTASEIEQLIRAKPAIAVSLNNLGNLAIERGDAATAQASYR